MTRPRGFAPYRPQGAARGVIDAVSAVLDEYREHLPLTIRQIFYRLVALEVLDKSEREYSRLAEILNRARRGDLVDFEAIRDDGVTRAGGNGYTDLDDVLSTLRGFVTNVRLDRQAGQAERLQIWCEAGGMVPQLQRVAEPYGVAVISSGGFDSVTVKHAMGRDLSDCPTTILHLGDHDPSGVHVFTSLAEDVSAFADAYGAGDGVRFVRLAVTPEQAWAHRLPSAPPKVTDRRSFEGTATWQCEALPPDVLADTVRSAIDERLNPHTLASVLKHEAEVRRLLAERLDLGAAS